PLRHPLHCSLTHPSSHPPPFFFTDTPPTEIYTLSLHDALPICSLPTRGSKPSPPSSLNHRLGHFPSLASRPRAIPQSDRRTWPRSEEHTSELQSLSNLVCRLLLEKKKRQRTHTSHSYHTHRTPR